MVPQHLNDEKKNAKEHNIAIKEYRFLKNQAVISIDKGNDLDLVKNLQREQEK